MIDPDQTRAAESEADQLLVIAPPGCGKTELLAMRAAALIPRLRPNQRILALTFSNRARDNLADRMRQHLGPQQYRRFVRVRNFHGHATEVLRAHCRTIRMQPDFELPTKQLLERTLRGLSRDEEAIAAAKEALAAAKRAPRTDVEVAAALAASGSSLAMTVEERRSASLQLHYDDLLRHAQRLLQIDPVAYLFQQHYGALLVDEFQDLTLQQLDLALRSCCHNRTFVGDPLQGIYSWAGAAPAIVEKELTRLCGEPIRLHRSYRSSPAVLHMVNTVAVPLGAASLESAQPERWPNGGVAVARGFPTAVAEAAWIVEQCGRLLARDPMTTIGVIGRSQWRRKEVDAAFRQDDTLPVRHWDLAIEDPETLVRLTRAAAQLPRRATFDALRTAALGELTEADVDQRSDLLEAIETLAHEQRPGETIQATIERLRQPDDDQVITAGVHLLNAHLGKGQQFDWVFIPGVEDGHIPDFRVKTSDDLLEEQRVLLVMLSRAKSGIAVSHANQRLSKRGKPYSLDLSPWWHVLARSATSTEVMPSAPAKMSEADASMA